MTSQVVSLGYERRDVGELIDILKDLQVVRLIDVRERPLSRKRGFSKNKLAEHLENAGICYKHIYEAGNPFHKLKVDLHECLRLYSDYLEDNPQVIELVESVIIEDTPVALLCYERHHLNCHRSVLIEKILQQNDMIELITVE